MRHFWVLMLVIVFVASASFDWSMPGPADMTSPQGVATALAPSPDATDAADQLEGCCADGLTPVSDSGPCSLHCANTVWSLMAHERDAVSAVFGAAVTGAETSALLAPFRPPIV